MLYRLTVHLSFFPSENQVLTEVTHISLESREPSEGAFVLRLLSGVAACSPGALFSTISASACQKCNIFQMKFNDFIFDFSKSCCGSHSGNISACASTCRKHCGHPILTKLCRFNFSHIFPMVFQCFYVSAIRRRVGEVAKVATELSQHEALKGAHVLKTYCASRFARPVSESILTVWRHVQIILRFICFRAHMSARLHCT